MFIWYNPALTRPANCTVAGEPPNHRRGLQRIRGRYDHTVRGLRARLAQTGCVQLQDVARLRGARGGPAAKQVGRSDIAAIRKDRRGVLPAARIEDEEGWCHRGERENHSVALASRRDDFDGNRAARQARGQKRVDLRRADVVDGHGSAVDIYADSVELSGQLAVNEIAVAPGSTGRGEVRTKHADPPSSRKPPLKTRSVDDAHPGLHHGRCLRRLGDPEP